VEKLVDMFLIPPSEVIASLQGGIHIEVLEKRHGYPAVGLILLLAGMCSCSRRRLDEDLRDALGRINTEYLLAMGSLPKEAKAFPLLRTRLKRVRKDARRTAARVQSLRDAIRRIDRAALESQIEALQCDEDGNSIMGRERSKALREKCKVREMLDRLEQDERRSVVQLQRIADTLTTAHLRFRGIWISDPTAGSDELVLEQMGFELDALERTTSEIREFEHQIHISRTV
jgi:hypothetical protein